jgi:hypothetical protein
MFARCVTAKLKTGAATQVPDVMENTILPLLRKQNGFRDEVTLIAPDGSALLALSFWDTKGDAETYSRTAYRDVLKALAEVVEGAPEVQPFEVSNSTLHKIAAKGA